MSDLLNFLIVVGALAAIFLALIAHWLMQSDWSRIVLALEKTPASFRNAIGWPDNEEANLREWPFSRQSSKICRKLRMRIGFRGLPDLPNIASDARPAARRFMFLSWTFVSIPLLVLPLVAGLWFVTLYFIIALVITRWMIPPWPSVPASEMTKYDVEIADR